MKRFKVNLIFRKSSPHYHSLERVFESLIPEFENRVDIKKSNLPYSGASPQILFKNMLYSRRFKKYDINHITGDVHYVALVCNRRSILTVHDINSALSKNVLKNLYIRLFWFWLPSLFVKRITVISDFTKREVERMLPFAKKKIVVIPNPIGENFKFFAKDFNREYPNILLIGTKANKNLENSILAIKEMNCSATIIGKLSQQQIDMLTNLEIDYENKFNISDIEILRCYEEADIVCFPSTYEGFGMPIIEAQAIGRPVLSSDIEPMNSISGQGACLVDPYSVEEISTGLKRIIDDVEYRNELIYKGLENSKRFESNNVAQKYLELYEGILKSPKS